MIVFSIWIVYPVTMLFAFNSEEIQYKKIDDWNERAWELRKTNPSEAFSYADSALILSQELGYRKGEGDAYCRLGIIYKQNAYYPDALNSFFKSQKIREELGNEKGFAGIYNNLGNIYRILNQHGLAKSYYEKSLFIHRKYGNIKGQMRSYQNLGLHAKLLGKKDSTLYFYKKGLEIDPSPDKKSIRVGEILNNIGSSFYKEKQLDSATYYFNKSLLVKIAIGDSVGMVETLNNIGVMKVDQGEYQLAIDSFLLKSLHIARSFNYPDLLSDIQLNLMKAYNGLEDSVKAFSYMKAYFLQKESLPENNIDNIVLDRLIDVELQRELDKEIHQNRVLKMSLAGLVLFLVVVVGMIMFQKKLRATRRKNEFIQNRVDILIKEQKVKSMKDRIVGQNMERKRVSKELHNRLNNHLASIKLNLGAIKDPVMTLDPKHSVIYEKAVSILNESIEKVRKISHDLDSDSLSESGIVPALKKVKDAIEFSGKIKVDLDCGLMEERLNTELEVTVFDLVNELINNILKHAQATCITIQLIPSEEDIILVVEDNGVGFDTQQIRYQKGLGLKLLSETVEDMEGSFTIDSSVLGGTTIFVSLPLVSPIHSE